VTTRTSELVVQARYLRNAAPQAYDDFCKAFAAYTRQTFDDLIETNQNLSVIQGQAQQCKKLLQLLEGAKNG